jgi:predicted TIM-barrel fold metal-dependent hydrolase
MWSTDFPHIVTRWPKSLELMEEQFAGVPADEKQAMVAGNAVKFFHLDAA